MVEPQGNGGFLGVFKRILSLIVGILGTKLELIGVELQEEKKRIIELLILASVAVLFGILGFTVVTFALIVILLKVGYVEAVLALGIIYLIGGIILGFVIRNKVRESGLIFEATANEFKKDVEWIRHNL